MKKKDIKQEVINVLTLLSPFVAFWIMTLVLK